jgi:AraC-like DNA-binding protein
MIKASYEVLQLASGQSFISKKFGSIAFDAPYHFHPELELTYITKGNGKRYVGNHMGDFIAGDLVMLGPNLPHCWKTESLQTDAAAIVVQFKTDFLGDAFDKCPEFQAVNKLMQLSASGLSFADTVSVPLERTLSQLVDEENNFKKLQQLLTILNDLANTTAFELLDHQRAIGTQTLADQVRINPVFAYMVENFRNEVSLDEAAGIANMTTNAFCKYFKKITRKTFMETVIDYRLNYATQQLVQTDKPISQISFESGFGDISHFYKTFKSKMQLSPLSYRKKFIRHLSTH